jgi:ribonuclease VapC
MHDAARPKRRSGSVFGELPLARLPVDEELAYATGMMSSATRAAGLYFGDRACLALAQRLGVKALTADRAWLQIAQAVGVEVEVIR